MEVIYIIGAAQALFLPFLIVNKKGKSTADYVLAAWFVLIGLALFSYHLEVIGQASDYPVFLGFSTCFALLMGPAAYFYVTAITRADHPFKPIMLLHAVPYVFFTIIVLMKLFVYPDGSIEETRLIIEDPEDPVFITLGLFRIFLGLVYFITCLVILRKHTRRIADEFSYTENIDLNWLKKVVLVMLVIWIIVVVANLLGNFNDWIPMERGDDLIYLTLTIAVFFGGFYGIKQQVIFSSEPGADSEKQAAGSNEKVAQYRRSSLTREKSQALLKKLLQYMDQEQPYLDGKISLAQLARSLGTSSNHLSQVINENLNKNFYDFMNGYRVELVKQRLTGTASENLNLLSIAYDCGFNSKSAFNEVFKKNTGLTPTQFRKQLQR